MKKAPDHKIVKRKDGRHQVRKRGGGSVNGLEKTEILLAAGLIKTKLPTPAPVEEAAAPEEAAPAEETAAE